MAAALEMALPVLLFIGLPCKWAVISFLGKNALLLKLELMVLCLIWTMPLSSSPKHALLRKRAGGREGKRRKKHIFQELRVSPEKFGCNSFLGIAIFLKIKIQKKKHCQHAHHHIDKPQRQNAAT